MSSSKGAADCSGPLGPILGSAGRVGNHVSRPHKQIVHPILQPTFSPPQPKGLSPALARNIRALEERRSKEERKTTLQERIAEAITRFAGSMTFVGLHVVLFGVWTLVNTGLLPVLPKWDESFVILGTSASVETIFLSTFVLIS
jgi:hypothetical protein